MKMRVWLIAPLIISTIASPLFSVKKDTRMVLEEIGNISRLVADLDKKLTLLHADIRDMNKKMEILGDRISAISNNQADYSQNKESIALNLQALKEELGEIKGQIVRLNDRMAGPVPSTAGDTGNETGVSSPTTPTISPQDASNLYYTAYSDYIKENYDLAIRGFRQYLSSFPGSGLSDNALYWIGECFYAKKNYSDAIATFSEVITKFKDGDKVPASYLKKGFSLSEMGKQSEGISVMKELISRYPFSDEATIARQKLKEFNEES